jgi:hypothetical protein
MVPLALSCRAKKPGSSTAVEVGQWQAAVNTGSVKDNYFRSPCTKYNSVQQMTNSFFIMILPSVMIVLVVRADVPGS